VVLVVDDSHDDELTAAIAEENMVPSDRFRGGWQSVTEFDLREGTQQDAAEFVLLERDDGPMRRCWSWANPGDDLVDLVADHSHLVALLPKEYAGHEAGEIDAHELIPRLGGTLIVDAEPSEHVAALRDERRR
jgi:hypothetical protein